MTIGNIAHSTECVSDFDITKLACDILGIENLDLSAASLTEQIVRESLKETIRLAHFWSKKCARKSLAVVDVESILRTMQSAEDFKRPSVDTLNYGIDQLAPVSGLSNIFSFPSGDAEVDKEDTETYTSVPRDLRLISYSLVGEGQPATSAFTLNQDDEDNPFLETNIIHDAFYPKVEKKTSSFRESCTEMFRNAVKLTKVDQKVGLKPVSVETLTIEQQIFMKDIITVCMGQDDKKRLEALYTLETDAGLQIVLPHLVQRICKSISANISQRCLSLIIYAGRMLRAISHNKACDMTVTLHDVLPALLSCCVGRNMCLKPETDNHWALRDFSAKTLVGLIRDQIDLKDGGETSRRLFAFAYSVFSNPLSSLSMIYGTIYILEEFVEAGKVQWLTNEFSDMSSRCKQLIDRHGVQSIQEATKLNSQIAKCDGILKNKINNSRWHH